MRKLSISEILTDYRLWILCLAITLTIVIGGVIYCYANTKYCCDIQITSDQDTKVDLVTPTGNIHFSETVHANKVLYIPKYPLKEIIVSSPCNIKYSSEDVNIYDIISFLSEKTPIFIYALQYILFITTIIIFLRFKILEYIRNKVASSLKDNKYEILGHFAFLGMLIFATIFAIERSVQSDSAAQIMQMINDKDFVFYENRFSAILPQLIPIIFIKLNAPLKAVIISYSLCPVVIGYIFYILCTRTLKNKIGGLLIISMLPVIQHTFFRSIAETYQLMYFAAFLWVWISHKPHEHIVSHVLYHIVLAVITFLCIFIHPVSIFFVAFIISFKLVDKRNIKDKRLISGTICFVVLLLLKSFLTDSSGYDANLINTSVSKTIDTITNLFSLPVIKTIIEYSYFYIFPTILLTCTTAYYTKHKQWLKLTYTVGFNIMYFFVAIIIYTDSGGTWTIERAFIPHVFFTMLPFAKDVLPNLRPNMENIFFCWITMLTITFFIGLPNTSRRYTKRIDEIEKIVTLAHEKGKQKLMIKPSECDMKYYEWESFCLPNATMFISALDGPENTVYLYREGSFYYESVNPKDSTTICIPFQGTRNLNDLNKNYFILPRTPFYELKHNNGEYIIEEMH